MIIVHGGNKCAFARKIGCAAEEIIDLSSNINPLGHMPELIRHLESKLSYISMLPEPDAKSIIEKFSSFYKITSKKVLVENGTSQFIHFLPMALKSKKTLILGPSYADYKNACFMYNLPFSFYFIKEENAFNVDMNHFSEEVQKAELVFICNPNNPTGTLIEKKNLEFLCEENPETIFVIDESYLPFLSEYEDETMLNCRYDNVIVLHSFSKIYKIPGLRIGFLIASDKIVKKICKYQIAWSVNILAQSAASFLLDEKELVADYLLKTQKYLEAETKWFQNQLQDSLLQIFPSRAPFLLIKHKSMKASLIASYFAKHKVLIRDCSNFDGLSDQFIRLSLKDHDTNKKVVQIMQNLTNKSR